MNCSLRIACWVEEDPDEAVPSPIGDGTALAALRRVGRAIRLTQRVDRPRLLAPDGRYEHLPLRPAVIDLADLAVMNACANQLRNALDHEPSGLVAEAIDAAAGYLPASTADDLISYATRLGLLLSL